MPDTAPAQTASSSSSSSTLSTPSTPAWRAPCTGRPTPPRIEKLLKVTDKLQVLEDIRERCHVLSPYEMRQALDPQVTAEAAEAHLARHVPAIEGWRNALVVLPLTLTWLSLAVAGAAYQQSVEAIKSGTVPSFFQLWQQGFPSLSHVMVVGLRIPLLVNGAHIFTFADIAFLDFSILLLLFLLTAWAQIAEVSAYQKGRKLYGWLGKEIFDLCRESVSWSLNPAEQDKPRWAAEVQYVLGTLNDALAGVQQAVANFERSLATQGEAVTDIVDDAGQVRLTVAKLTEFYQFVLESYRELEQNLPEITRHVTKMASNEQISAQEWQHMTSNLDFAIQSIATVASRFGDPELIRRVRHSQEMYRADIAPAAGPLTRVRTFWRRATDR